MEIIITSITEDITKRMTELRKPINRTKLPPNKDTWY